MTETNEQGGDWQGWPDRIVRVLAEHFAGPEAVAEAVAEGLDLTEIKGIGKPSADTILDLLDVLVVTDGPPEGFVAGITRAVETLPAIPAPAAQTGLQARVDQGVMTLSADGFEWVTVSEARRAGLSDAEIRGAILRYLANRR